MRYEFSGCVLDTEAHTLLRDGEAQPIEPQVFDLLHLLVRNAGILVTKDHVIDTIWEGRIVSESAISARIAAVRKAVGDDGKRQAIIRTVARRGLQFIAEVTKPAAFMPAPLCEAAHPTIRYATAEDGAKIAFSVSGNGPPLLRLAHYPSHLEKEWFEPTERKMFDALGQKHTLIRIDQRGSGLSDLDIEEYRIEQSVRDAKAVLDTLKIDKTALLGTSSGAMVAVVFASMFPATVSHLMTLGGYVDGLSVRADNTDLPALDVIFEMAKTGWDIPGSPFVSGYLAVYFPTASPEVLHQIARNLQDSCPIENELRGRMFFNQLSVAEYLDTIRAPTLILHSQGDAVHPLAEGQKLARGIPGAELRVLESRNHYPLPEEESWHSMIDAMLTFLER